MSKMKAMEIIFPIQNSGNILKDENGGEIQEAQDEHSHYFSSETGQSIKLRVVENLKRIEAEDDGIPKEEKLGLLDEREVKLIEITPTEETDYVQLTEKD